MRLTNQIPYDVGDLKDKVCKYLNESGYTTESPKAIDMSRNKVEIDVFSTLETASIKHIICECKCWNTPITKKRVNEIGAVTRELNAVGIFITNENYKLTAMKLFSIETYISRIGIDSLNLLKSIGF